jgi:hypothetical protein
MAFGQGSSRWPDWLKMKNPDAPAVKREAEEDWGDYHFPGSPAFLRAASARNPPSLPQSRTRWIN